MRHLFNLFLALSSFFIFVFAQLPSLSPATITTVHQYPDPTWIENLAVRSNNQVLTTNFLTGELYIVDPPTQKSLVLHKFPTTAVTGIVEHLPQEPDVFYVTTGDYSLLGGSVTGSWSIWRVDMSCFQASSNFSSVQVYPEISEWVPVPEGASLNGMTVNENTGQVLVADAMLGLVWDINVDNQTYSVAYEDPLMAYEDSVGVNGIKVRGGYLYWTNTDKELLARLPISSNGTALGHGVVVTANVDTDDFCFLYDDDDEAFLAVANTIVAVDVHTGFQRVVAGNPLSVKLEGTTACEPARGEGNEGLLFVTTNGGLKEPILGVFTGGKLAAVQLNGRY